MKIALVGQPNCGKSTIFNAVVGYHSLTSNFSGTTVEHTRGHTWIDGTLIDLYDLPGLYSLTPANPAESSSRDCLLEDDWDVIVNVLDASQLSRSLELTLELRELRRPMVVCLNMMDEASRKGMVINVDLLAETLGLPVVEAIASRGRGIVEMLRIAIRFKRGGNRMPAGRSTYPEEIDTVIDDLAARLVPALASCDQRPAGRCCCRGGLAETLSAVAVDAHGPCTSSARAEALLLLQSDPMYLRRINPETAEIVCDALATLPRSEAQPPEDVIPGARHAACLMLFEETVRIHRPRSDWRERLDALVMHKLWGYVLLAAVFFGFFHLIFDAGEPAETRILSLFDRLVTLLSGHLNPHGLGFVAMKGALLGTAGAVGTVLPYLVPFLIGLAVMEDLGYLARIGYLMDSAMHRLGLHGTATLPVLLGYGCSVPAVMATRILHSRRDRFVASFLAVLVPCSARMTVIMALVGAYLGANWALAIYGINFVVVAFAGVLLVRIWPEVSPGMLMEVPPLRRPGLRVILLKTWWRLREFMTVATPMLIAGSVLLSAMQYWGLERWINRGLSPLTSLLGLPVATGLTLIFGVMRKELSLLMLMQALGTTHVAAAMTAAQIMVFTLFITFYLPCLATVAMLFKELGWKMTAAASGALLSLAVIVSVAARFVMHWVA
jgi:ferrous iron transport protein B